MPSRDELRLARAKALLEGDDWDKTCPSLQARCLRLADLIESSDAALGVVSVPVGATKEMILAGEDAYSNFEDSSQDTDGPYCFVHPGHEKAVYGAMLAASPLAKENPDE